MKRTLGFLVLIATLACEQPPAQPAAAPPALTVVPAPATALTTIGDSTTIIESVALFGGKLYTTDWNGTIWRIDPAQPAPVAVGRIPVLRMSPILGETFDTAGNLLIAQADSGIIWRVAGARLGAANFDPRKDATRFITGAPGANGIVVARDGHIWISGGETGKVYRAGPAGGAATVFADGFSPISADTTIGPRIYVANGAAIDSRGNFYTMNTGTGTIWRLEVTRDHWLGTISKVVESPTLIGADGVIVGPGDTLYVTQNFRNTFAKVSPTGVITVLVQADGSLRFPAELVRDGKTIYIANLNFPYGANAIGYRPGASIVRVTLP
jgi:hypothetical protein